jgi:DNA-binding beta-propeller fold protein YncE
VNRRGFLVAAAALPLALRSGRALAGGTPVALVTADTESRVVAVRLPDGKVLRSIPTLPGPRSIELAGRGGVAVVCHTAVAAVTLLDAARLRVDRVLRDFAEPRYTAAHPDGRHAYVTDSAASEVVAVDLVRGRTLGRARVGGWARHVSLDPSGTVLWVGLGTATQRLAVVDVVEPARPRLLRHVVPPWGAHDVGWLPSGRGVWVTSGDRGAMAVFDLDGRPRVHLPAGAPPQHVSFGRGVAYVASGDDGTLTVHDLRTGRVLRRTRVPVGSYNVQHEGAYVLTPSLAKGTLCVLDDGGRVLRERHIAASSHDACLVAI